MKPEAGFGTPEGRARYRHEQHKRMVQTVQACRRFVPDRSARVLDVGRSRLSALLLEHYGQVTTLGLPLEITRHYAHSEGWEPPPGKDFAGHVVCDLNRVPADVPEPRYDLIVFAEVIEHLYAAPEAALSWLGRMLRPGGILICTTPNAASLSRRIKLLIGKNPAERLRHDLNNPGHVREYVRRDLFDMGHEAELHAVKHAYFDGEFPRKGLVHFALGLMPSVIPSLSRSQMIVYRREATSA